MVTTEQYMLGYTLTALKMIEIGNYDACIDQIGKLVRLGASAEIPSGLAGDIKKHLEELVKIKQEEISNEERMAKFKKELLDLDIIFKRHGVK